MMPARESIEDEDAILADCRRVIETFHDPAPFSMVRVGVAPCSPFSVSRELMRDSAELARSYGVGLHTHLAENVEDVAYSLATFGARPGAYAEELGWCGPDVWHAHCVQLDAQEHVRARWDEVARLLHAHPRAQRAHLEAQRREHVQEQRVLLEAVATAPLAQ